MSFLSRFLTLAVFVFCSTGLYAETQYPLTVTDGLGFAVTLNKAPQKISSKTLFSDAVLLNMIDNKRLSSITHIASDPHYSAIANQLPQGIEQLDLNVEAILNNYPDIVFAANWSDAGKIEQLKKAGISVYLINTPKTIAAIQAEIQKLGLLVNAQTEAIALTEQMDARLAAKSAQKEAIAAAGLVALDYNSWGTASGVDTTWHEVLSQSGLVNGSAEFEQGDYGQVPMSKELIVAINPDVLFLPGWIYGDNDAAENFLTNTLNDPALQGVKAIKTGRVYQVPEGLRGTFSQYMVDTIHFVIDSVHADLDR